jgi:hypothetical protein
MLQSCYVQTCYVTNLLRFKLATRQTCYGVKLATGQTCYVQSCYFTKLLQTCYGQTCYRGEALQSCYGQTCYRGNSVTKLLRVKVATKGKALQCCYVTKFNEIEFFAIITHIFNLHKVSINMANYITGKLETTCQTTKLLLNTNVTKLEML